MSASVSSGHAGHHHKHATHHKHPAHHHHHHHHSSHVLEKVSTHKAVLHSKGWHAGKAEIEKGERSGALQRVSLDQLPLTHSYTPKVHSTGMKRKTEGFTWDHHDDTTHAWWPQAVTTSRDATGKASKREWTAVTWHGAGNHRTRVSFVDTTHPHDKSKAKYNHVELVIPDPAHPDGRHFKHVACHAGGVSWVGHYLYVADTHGGLRVFDTQHIAKLGKNAVAPKGTGPYVLPQVASYAQPHGSHIKFSGLSLDRAHHSLISQEYDAHKKGGKIVRWPIDLETGKLRTNKHGNVHATAAWKVPLAHVAGVAAVGKGFEIAQMSHPGGLYHATSGHHLHREDHFTRGIQQFSWDSVLGQIWTLAEHRNDRSVWHFKP